MVWASLTLGFRTLRRRRGYALTSGLSLAAGIACALLVMLYLQVELSYDDAHDDADRIHRLTKMVEGRDDVYVLHSGPVAHAVGRRYAEVETVTAFRPNFRAAYVQNGDGDRFLQETQTMMATWAGSAFFSVFSGYTFVRGDRATALQDPHRVVLPAKTARRYFGSIDVVGRTLRIGETELTVSGVLAPLGSPSHLTFDLLRTVPVSETTSSSSSIFYTYMKLRAGATPTSVTASMPELYGSVLPGARDPAQLSYASEPLRDIHLGTQVARPITPPVDVRYLWTFGILGAVVLAISCINHVNLTTAMHADRSTEMGMRKSMGAGSGQVARHVLLETILLTGMTTPVAVAAVIALRPAFNEMMNTRLPSLFLSPEAWGSAVILTLIVGLAAGLYPSLTLMKKSPPELFDGTAFSRTRGWTVRHGLIVVQFALLIGLVCGSVFVHRQLAHLQATDLGFNEDRVLQISNGVSLYERDEDGNAISPRYREFQERLESSPLVLGLSSVTRTPGEFWYTVSFSPVQDTTDVFQAVVLRTDHRIFDVLEIESRHGAYFERPLEDRPDRALLVSTNFQDKLDPAGDFPPSRVYYNSAGRDVSIDGTFETINFFSLRDTPTPVVISARSEVVVPQRIILRLAPNAALSDGIRVVQDAWNEVRPDVPMQYSFLDDQIEQMYAQEQQFKQLSVFLSGLALLLAMLGLIAVASFMTRLRVKEIGIRKSLGASVADILLLLNREFAALVGVALLIAAPIAWRVLETWLSGFAYRINLSVMGFAAIGGGALGLALIAVTLHTWQAARTDPVDVL